MNKPIGYCDHCGSPIKTPNDNYAGAFDDFCCKRCNYAADVERDKHYDY